MKRALVAIIILGIVALAIVGAIKRKGFQQGLERDAMLNDVPTATEFPMEAPVQIISTDTVTYPAVEPAETVFVHPAR